MDIKTLLNNLHEEVSCSVCWNEGGVRVCGDAVLRYFWCGFAVIFILTRGIAVSKH
jgi:hypothetical protein